MTVNFFNPPLSVYMLTTTDPVQRMTPVLDSMPVVRNWYNYLPGCYLIASWASTTSIAEQIRRIAPGCWFVITNAVPQATDGLFAKEVWDFINNPTDSGKHPVPNLPTWQTPMSGLPPNTLTDVYRAFNLPQVSHASKEDSDDDSPY